MTTTTQAARDGKRTATQTQNGAPEVIAKGVEWWAEATKPFMPGLGTGPFSLPETIDLMELVDRSFGYAGQMLDLQRDFTKLILGMLPSQEATGRTP